MHGTQGAATRNPAAPAPLLPLSCTDSGRRGTAGPAAHQLSPKARLLSTLGQETAPASCRQACFAR
ncbi:hypothetical protein VFPFJ_00847 [Purpureocillium lilacinum]|uniref:Uncharacterized protein n=1 Tax=Purpureocillium lilacinum TaxID=33203 RepID=A0A179HZ27_PURLI|nr:hypothetical protein VFPFJ_00847 [Purpureocillium lilacinum]OAQ86773.1 hypothetical protein VFPBJ_00813 [Purpureocillium lilacinum]OAQ94738.1 hypothetical protein VFPFJ_00847 [Purpureocillium lilacinum]